ncbi:MAG: UPF0262 family protein [Geminicoccaceae bacterium]|nr:UPF0262 family protein [Geminicoccaceae bacterium]
MSDTDPTRFDTARPEEVAAAPAPRAASARLTKIDLDETSIVRWNPQIEHERDVAIFDLLEDNAFALRDGFAGPYALHLSLRDATLVMRVEQAEGGETREIALPVRPLRRIIKDYFMICESYFDAIKGAMPSRIEAIDMARRGLHDEGSTVLRHALEERIDLDHATARRLFTLVCVLHLRG